MLESLVKPVLVLIVGYLIQLAFGALGVPLDAEVYNAIVSAIVVYLLSLFGVEGARRAKLL